MKMSFRIWNRMSLLYKLIVVYLILIVVPTLFISYVGYKAHRETMEENVNHYARETLQQFVLNIETYLSNVIELSVLPYYDSQLMALWKFPSSDAEAVAKMGQAALKFSDNSVLSKRSDINGVVFVGGSTGVLSFLRGGYIDASYEYTDTAWYREGALAAGRPILVGGEFAAFTSNESERIITISRMINDLDTYKAIGMFVIHVNLSTIRDVVRRMNPQGGIYLFDYNNRPIYGDFVQGTEQALTDFLQNTGRSHTTAPLTLDGRLHQAHLVMSDRTGVKALYLIPVEPLVKNQKIILYSTISLALVSVLISILIFYYIARRLTTPLKELQRLMRKVEMGHFDVRFQSEREDEIGRLGSGFNYMVTEMRKMFHNIYEANLRKKDAELQILRNQINPHFLYNTLESINMVAELKGAYEISDMIGDLGELLRLSLKRSSISTVEEEIRYVQIYMSIRQIRSGNPIAGEYEVEEAIMAYRTLKLILQPLVENAIDHGLSGKQGRGTIRVRAKREGALLRFYVSDDGRGMSAGKLAEIQRRLTEDGADDHSIGLKNVHERIRLQYGNRYGIRICSEEGYGTTVQLTLPVDP